LHDIHFSAHTDCERNDRFGTRAAPGRTGMDRDEGSRMPVSRAISMPRRRGATALAGKGHMAVQGPWDWSGSVSSLPVHRSIVLFDIERSTNAFRTNPVKRQLREELYRVITEAMSYTGIQSRWHDPFEDRGDGVLMLIRPVDQLPKTHLLSKLIPELTRQLVGYNLALPPDEWQRRGLRLRAVVHAGEVHRDGNGYFGEAIDVACRMLDAAKLRSLLREAAAPLVLAVSEAIYWGLVKHEYDGIKADTYSPDFKVTVAGRRHQAFVHVPSTLVAVSAHGEQRESFIA
jgi:class 3 adenylate cyclase